MPVTINGTTGITGPDGSASTPAVQGIDSNTGLFFPAADTVAISTGGTQRITIDSSGNLGLGVTPNTWFSSAKVFQIGNGLSLWSSGNTNAFLSQNLYLDATATYRWITANPATNFSQNNGAFTWQLAAGTPSANGAIGSFTTHMTLDASGLLGIGTTSPAGLLDIQGTQTFSLLMTRFGSSANTALRRANGTQATPTIINNGETIHQITFQGYDGVSAYQSAARISAIIDGATISASSMPGALLFATTASGSTTLTERARITSGGNLDLQKNLGLGGTSATTSGTGITFPATQSASTDANTLDDYEEGTFTATAAGSTSGTITLNSGVDLLAYTKIGRVVFIQGLLEVSSVSSPVGTSVLVQNLPFTIADLTEYAGRGGTACYAKGSVRGIQMLEGETRIYVVMDASTLTSGDQFYLSFNYIAA